MKIKIFALGTMLLIGIVLVAGIVKNRIDTPTEAGIYPLPIQSPTPLSTHDRGDNWKQYVSDEHGFSIDLPNKFSIELDNSKRSNLDPTDTEIRIKDEYGNIQVRLSVMKYEVDRDYYDLLNDVKGKENYSEPTEVYVNSAKGIYAVRSMSDGFSSVWYLFPHTTETYISMSYTALKREVESSNWDELIQEQIVRTFSFL